MIFPKAGFGTTILTDDTLRMYTSGGGKHAEQIFIEENKNRLGDLFPWLWINNSPCPVCANKLIEAYAHVEVKPVIAAAHFYSGNDKRKVALHCLAKMVKEGFTLTDFPWRWYQEYISEPACKKDINEALKSDEFKKKMQKMSKTVEEVYAYKAQDKTNCP
jgi:hypothetical protein